MYKIVLASASPRRKKILEQLNLEFEIVVNDVAEKVDADLSNEENVERLALQKALNVAEKIKDTKTIIIAADTMVVGDALIGKPSTEEEAFCILKNLSGKVHQVITGVCVFSTEENRAIVSNKTTNVKFAKYDEELIWRYIRTGEIWGKAGAYAIQGLGAILVESIEGCYFNVVGLPIILLREMLEEFDVHIL